MRNIVANNELIAACSLYCGACCKYLSDRCPGCHDNEKATSATSASMEQAFA